MKHNYFGKLFSNLVFDEVELSGFIEVPLKSGTSKLYLKHVSSDKNVFSLDVETGKKVRGNATVTLFSQQDDNRHDGAMTMTWHKDNGQDLTYEFCLKTKLSKDGETEFFDLMPRLDELEQAAANERYAELQARKAATKKLNASELRALMFS